jgi:hypothetical protein
MGLLDDIRGMASEAAGGAAGGGGAESALVLPGIVDKLTPDGIVPDPGALADKLTGLIKGL